MADWFMWIVLGVVVLTYAETLAWWLLWPRSFRWGIRIMNEPTELDADMPDDDEIEVMHGRFRRLESGEWVFRRSFVLVWKSALPIKGALVRRDDQIWVEGRIPILASLLFGGVFMLFAWNILSGLAAHAPSTGVGSFALVLAVFVVLDGLMLSMELDYARRAVRELEVRLARRS